MAWLLIEHGSEDGNMHVIPDFGPTHQENIECWCKPHKDVVTDKLIIHEVQQ